MTLVRSAPGLIQKVALYCSVMILFFFTMIVYTPSPANAEGEPSVADWLENGQQNGQNDDKEPKANDELDNANERSPMLLIGQLIFYTLIILILIYALIKFLALKQKKLQPNQAINLIGGTTLGNNKSLQLVKVGGKVYLIGVADQITLIKEFSNKEEISLLESDLDMQHVYFSNSWFGFLKQQREKNQKGNFEQLFNQSLNKQKEKQMQLEDDLVDDNEEGRGKR